MYTNLVYAPGMMFDIHGILWRLFVGNQAISPKSYHITLVVHTRAYTSPSEGESTPKSMRKCIMWIIVELTAQPRQKITNNEYTLFII